MSEIEPRDGIQEEPRAETSRVSSDLDSAPVGEPRPTRTRSAGTMWGAVTGLPLGALTAGVGCWITDYGDFAWHGALGGCVVGAIGGGVVGFVERTQRGDLVKPDIATIVGIVFGLLLALFAYFALSDYFAGGSSGLILVLLMLGGPMGGFAIGASLDRANEARLQRSWMTSIGFTVLGIGMSLGAVHLIAAHSDPDPKDVAKEVWELVRFEWRNDPNMQGATIRDVKLELQNNRLYTGILEASLDGARIQFDLEVHVRHSQIKADWKRRP